MLPVVPMQNYVSNTFRDLNRGSGRSRNGLLALTKANALQKRRLVCLPSRTRLPASTTAADSEFDNKATPFGANPRDQCSTPQPISTDAVLRDISRGTRYCRVRLDYHP